jgi:hypothetical protein
LEVQVAEPADDASEPAPVDLVKAIPVFIFFLQDKRSIIGDTRQC